MPEGTFSASYDATTKAVFAVVCLILSARVHAFRTGHRRQAADREHSGTAFLLCLCETRSRGGGFVETFKAPRLRLRTTELPNTRSCSGYRPQKGKRSRADGEREVLLRLERAVPVAEQHGKS